MYGLQSSQFWSLKALVFRVNSCLEHYSMPGFGLGIFTHPISMGLSWSKTWSSKWLLSHISSCCHLTSLPGRQLSWGSQEWLWVDILLGEGTSLASADSPFWIPGGNFTCLDFFLSSGGRKWNHGFFFFLRFRALACVTVEVHSMYIQWTVMGRWGPGPAWVQSSF